VIQRALASVKHLIDYWVIVDTGSTDGTQDLIRDFLHDIPGELHERPWVDFAHNRNEALAFAKNKADYLLFIDADEQWFISNSIDKKALKKDFYAIKIRDNSVDFYRMGLIRNISGWQWVGVLHEELTCPNGAYGEILHGVESHGIIRDGKRSSDPEIYLKDAAILEKALEKDPTNTRYLFYLAQSYCAARDYRSALKYFKRRSEVKGSEDEVFWALYSIGGLQEELDMDFGVVLSSYCKAHQYDPSRAEPLDGLARYFHRKGLYFLGYLAAKESVSLPFPKTLMYLQRDIYQYASLLKLAHCAYGIGNYQEADLAYLAILSKEGIDEEVRETAKHSRELLQSLLDQK
jgi:glycosyltransferase involved in cell wall biosynthesis